MNTIYKFNNSKKNLNKTNDYFLHVLEVAYTSKDFLGESNFKRLICSTPIFKATFMSKLVDFHENSCCGGRLKENPLTGKLN